MKNYRLVLSYDGSRYRGWQKQGNTENTVQQKLETALSRILGEDIEAAGSGRTDAGVHALCQTVSFKTGSDMSTAEILAALRSFLPEDIGAMSLQQADSRFHARLSCKGKTYLYRMWRGDEPCVFQRRYVWRVEDELNVELMKKAAELLLGEHDFSAFCAIKMKKSAIRRVDAIEIEEAGAELRLKFSGNGFLYNMVRIMTGALVEVGAGRMECAELEAMLLSKKRSPDAPTAPAQGLCLLETCY